MNFPTISDKILISKECMQIDFAWELAQDDSSETNENIEDMLADIKKNTCDWQPAYTEEEDEPIYLPGSFPNLIVNGTTGIAVAMACSFAPHNMNEIMDGAVKTVLSMRCHTTASCSQMRMVIYSIK